MQKIVLIFLSFLLCVTVHTQVVFKTIATEGPVVVGESFSVQYVLEATDPDQEFYAPNFKDFRFVNGPYVYEGKAPDGVMKLKNIVYTLEAIKPGRFRIPAARAVVYTRAIESDDAWIEVISKAEAMKRQPNRGGGIDAVSFLQPGENARQKIKENLFLKVMVDKKNCFVGEPVLATYKLYSRLNSNSDIVKNPGFYGFTVYDMVELNDKKPAVEMVNGKKFDVHTIRKVQLYPLRAGQFIIDPMEVINTVKFSQSMVTKKAEQKIVEGVFKQDDDPATINTKTYNDSMSTLPVTILVKPSPPKNQPADFTGATGRFSIHAAVNTTKLAKNEEGKLTITVSGKGNFTQLGTPAITWPEGIEGFDVQVVDTFDHSRSPLNGERAFHFSFVSTKPGSYSIPGIRFSFFDPDSNRYKTVSTQPITITISNQEKAVDQKQSASNGTKSSNKALLLWGVAIVLLTVAGSWLLWLIKKGKAPENKVEVAKEPTLPSVDEILKPATLFSQTNDKSFYALLRSCILNFFSIHFSLSGSNMNSRNMVTVMSQKKVNDKCQQDIIRLLQQCETGIFTDAYVETNRIELLKKTREVLKEINELL